MPAAPDCQRVADEDLIPRFVRGSLPGAEAERLEAHCFECDACWAQLQAATALSASMAAERAPVQRTWNRQWSGWLAAAATIAIVVGVASRWLPRETPRALPAPVEAPAAVQESPEPIERGAASGSMPLTIREVAGHSIEIAWALVPGAVSYRVGLFSDDGREVWSSETSGLSVVVPAAALAARPSRSGLTVQAEARNVMGAHVARSRPGSVPVVR